MRGYAVINLVAILFLVIILGFEYLVVIGIQDKYTTLEMELQKQKNETTSLLSEMKKDLDGFRQQPKTIGYITFDGTVDPPKVIGKPYNLIVERHPDTKLGFGAYTLRLVKPPSGAYSVMFSSLNGFVYLNSYHKNLIQNKPVFDIQNITVRDENLKFTGKPDIGDSEITVIVVTLPGSDP